MGNEEKVVSLAAVREARGLGRPTREEYVGALFEWRLIGERLAPQDLAVAVGYLRGWPAPVVPTARVYPFARVRS